MNELSYSVDSLYELQINDEVRIGNVLHHVRRFSRGGMGLVIFLMRDQNEPPHHILAPTVAIKAVLPADDNQTIRNAFQREMTIWAGLSHANIVQLKEILVTRSDGWVAAMDWCVGSLRNLLDDRSVLSTQEAIFIIRDLVAGLQYALKEYGLLHLDLKPANVLYQHDLFKRMLKHKDDPVRQHVWKISDWGLASTKNARLEKLIPSLFSDEFLTINNLGTAAYMAPERFVSGTRSSIASDLYAVGLIFYEMLIGHLPSHFSELGIVEQICSGRFFRAAATQLNEQRTPKAVAEIILRLIDPDPEIRGSGYIELIDRLNQLQRPRSLISRLFKSN
ncbi:MAG: serine/threonine protein kinase [Prosthecobacter sp.]|jgi:serine/threonine protein kinase|uniref:serine/threonine-protein kinase n=1 Tax=Prosthecobacter sp. TaxID=1965333 RepID=UPI0019F55BCC|nr:serine/threonine-protein kinase [Prosthecobacter sp.]MBE2282404.1 serine/threonine protein kinase [Prosthecobacter sp.]